MEKNKNLWWIMAAMMAALVCAATMVVRIPSPVNGYINLGDGAVLLAAWLLGPLGGAAAGGLGSMLADVFSDYLHYAPGTLVIKAASAAVAAGIGYLLRRRGVRSDFVVWTTGGIVGELVMVGGYFLYASLLLGKGWAAAASIPGNLVQGGAGVILSVLLMTAVRKTGRIPVWDIKAEKE